MAKCAVAIDANGVFGSTGSSKTVVVFTPAKNPDGSVQKDTRK